MLAAIGEVASECAVLEERLRVLFCHLIDSPYGSVITSGEDISNVSKMCLRVAQYNSRLDDAAMERLVTILKAVELIRPYRNFLVHARWERLNRPGEHVGLRSSRASTGPNGNHTDELRVWSVADALNVANRFREIVASLDKYIQLTFDDAGYAILMRRTDVEKMATFFSRIGWEPVAEEPPVPPAK